MKLRYVSFCMLMLISVYTAPQKLHLGWANMMLSTQIHTCFPGRDFIYMYHTIKVDTGSKLLEKAYDSIQQFM